MPYEELHGYESEIYNVLERLAKFHNLQNVESNLNVWS